MSFYSTKPELPASTTPAVSTTPVVKGASEEAVKQLKDELSSLKTIVEELTPMIFYDCAAALQCYFGECVYVYRVSCAFNLHLCIAGSATVMLCTFYNAIAVATWNSNIFLLHCGWVFPNL